MMRRGIVIGDTGDLKVQVVRDAAGVITQGLVVSDNDGDCVQLIVESNKGEFKAFPVLGVGEQYLKSVGRVAEMRADIMTQLELDGCKADVRVTDDGRVVIDVE